MLRFSFLGFFEASFRELHQSRVGNFGGSFDEFLWPSFNLKSHVYKSMTSFPTHHATDLLMNIITDIITEVHKSIIYSLEYYR